MFTMRVSIVVALALLPVCVVAQTIQVPVTADNSIIDVQGERDYNMGKVTGPRIKSFQHHLILKFDTSELQGKTVKKAWLRYAPRDFLLNRVTLSTIQADWGEGDSGGFAESVGGSTYNNAFHGATPAESTPWAWQGSHFPDVAYGNSHSLTNESDCAVVDDRYLWELDVDLVHANAVGAAHGLAVFESEHDLSRNPTVESAESGTLPPFVELELGPAEEAPAPFVAVEDLTSSEAERGEILLSFDVPARAFTYRVAINGAPVARYQVPFAGTAGTKQRIRIRDVLSPGQSAAIELVAVNRSGHTNNPVIVETAANAREPMPLADQSPPAIDDAGSGPVEAGGLRVWAAPETDKIRPDGTFLEGVSDDYRYANSRFWGKEIRLRAARRETVAFLLVLEAVSAPVAGLTVTVAPPDGVAARVQAVRSISTSIGPIPEVLVGPQGTILGPSLSDLATNGDAGAPGAKVQLLLVELDVPADMAALTYEAAVQITGGPEDVDVPLSLSVRGFALPASPAFYTELNTYGWPSHYATYVAIQRMARRFRCHVNYVPYNHQGRTRMDMKKPDGAYMDEDAYNDFQPGDTTGNWEPDFLWAFDPFFTGDVWTAPDYEGPGASLPLAQYYLTFHENWPLPMKDHWNGSMDAFSGFPATYGETWTAVLKDFAKLAKEHGWNGTGFQIMLTNKPCNACPTPWTLDEPASLWDFRALDYYASLVEDAGLDQAGPKIVYRTDISRPHYHRGYLDRVGLYVCGNGVCYTHARIVSDQQERVGFELWTYGGANKVSQSNHHIQAWAAKAFAQGANGVVPWQAVGEGAGYLDGVADESQQSLALIIAETDNQDAQIWGTLRLAAYRRAQQDMEYLRLAKSGIAGGYTRGQMANLVGRYLDPEGTVPTDMHFADYAGALPMQTSSATVFHGLREHAAMVLAEAPVVNPEPGEDVMGQPDQAGQADIVGQGDGAGQDELIAGIDSGCDPNDRGVSGEGEACTKTEDCLCGLACLPQGDFLLCAALAVDEPNEGSDSGCSSSAAPNSTSALILLLALAALFALRGLRRSLR